MAKYHLRFPGSSVNLVTLYAEDDQAAIQKALDHSRDTGSRYLLARADGTDVVFVENGHLLTQ